MAKSDHLLNIAEVFRAEASTVSDTFATEMGIASFRVPIYQRNYSWDKEKINRLFEDVAEGLTALGKDEDYLTFLGTIILVDESKEKEQSFDGRSLSVVDGQQRLSTLALTCCELYSALSKESKLVDGDDPFSSALRQEKKLLCNKLFACAIGQPSGPQNPDKYDYFPRIVRAESDIRSALSEEARYRSPIASYLFQFSESARTTGLSPDNVDAFGAEADNFKARLEIIRKWIERIGQDESDDDIQVPRTVELFEGHEYRRVLFPWLQQRTDHIKDVLQTVRSQIHSDPRPFVRLVGFGNYLMQRVAMTMVVARDERYAFDIFGALNTTGEPLTAIETFKPNIIRAENEGPATYEGSPSKEALEIIEQHIQGLGSYERQQREAAELVVLLALYVSGERRGLRLNEQRRYLRSTYEKAALRGKRTFTRSLSELADFRGRFWSTADQLSNQIRSAPEKEVGFICLRFLFRMRNSLTIPILCRYWMESEKRADPSLFVDAVKAVTAFVVLRRSATGGTANIDSDLRRMMSQGPLRDGGIQKALQVGIGDEPAELPDLTTLKGYLREYLSQSRVGVSNREDWLRRVVREPLYNSAAVLCRFMVLVAAHFAVPDPDPNRRYLLKRGRRNPEKDYLNLSTWENEDYSTIEHVAPQGRMTGWDDSVYEDPNLVHCLGNLTLLPEKLNISIGSKPWAKKRLFYRAAAATTESELLKCFREAEDNGLTFGEKIKKALEGGRCIPVLSSVGEAESWDSEVIRERTENIAELVWEHLADWLNWDGGGEHTT